MLILIFVSGKQPVEKQMEKHGAVMKSADLLGLELMSNCVPEDVPSVQTMVDEYRLLWTDITQRLKALRESYTKECCKRSVSDL